MIIPELFGDMFSTCYGINFMTYSLSWLFIRIAKGLMIMPIMHSKFCSTLSHSKKLK